MKSYKEKLFECRRVPSLVPKLQSSQSKSSNAKDSQFSHISQTRKYLHPPQQTALPADQTDKFLLQTRKKLLWSTEQLSQFHKKRQSYKSKKENMEFSILSRQLKSTKQKLKNKHFFGSKIANKTNRTQNNNHWTINHLPYNRTVTQDKQQSKTTDKQNNSKWYQTELNEKLQLVDQALSREQLVRLKEEIHKKILSIEQCYKQDPQLKVKLTRYFISYQIMSRFLQQCSKSTSNLQIKHSHISLYYRMKSQMISLLSNEQFFTQHLQNIEHSQNSRHKALYTKTLYQQQRFVKTNTKSKFMSTSSDKTLLEKIQELFETSKDNIKEAFNKFGYPHLMYQIELEFSNRFKQGEGAS